MSLLADAWINLRRNQFELFFYLGALALFSLAVNTLELALGVTPESGQAWLPTYRFVLTLISAVFHSAIMALVFARLGEDIDKPLWRCPSGFEALQRFFLPWFILNLSVMTLISLLDRAVKAEQEGMASLLMLLFMLACVMLLPVGACIMYHGRLIWSELGIALRPLAQRFDLSFLVFTLLAFQFVLLVLVQGFAATYQQTDTKDLWVLIRTRVLFWPLAAIPLNLCDLLAFAMTWRICMVNRDEELEEDDPFDF